MKTWMSTFALVLALTMISTLGAVAVCSASAAGGLGLPGDFNNDGFYDCSDADALVQGIAAGSTDPNFDLNGDGIVSRLDLDVWRAVAGEANLPSGNPYLEGDANLDSVVDGLDFINWNGNKFTVEAAWCAGDMNADGVIDGQDFILWNAHKFTQALRGTPGDGTPDVYYYAAEATAPNGETRAAGTLSLDTDGADLAAVLVASPDLTGDCLLCDGDSIASPDGPQFFTVGAIAGSTQWIRTSPLDFAGPTGVIDLALLTGLGASDFPGIFDGFSVLFASNDGTVYSTNVMVVEAPVAVETASWGDVKALYR